MLSLQEMFRKLYRIADSEESTEKLLLSPQFWTPWSQAQEKISLISHTREIIRALQSERIILAQVSWKQLEEIVAEILRSHGMEIHIVKESPQGGRDIIARGVLIPGEEPITIAVEVKHRPVVGRPEVQKALWQNRHFPALMFATSGRFTGGVLEEKRSPENHLRLILKDGTAIGDLIRSHPSILGK